MSEAWLEAFSPDVDQLLDVLLPLVDLSMLQEIAKADYGQDAEAHLKPLLLFKENREPLVLDWCPCEVLELIRWSQPDDPEWGPGGQGRYGHLLRAFACTALLRSYIREENHHTWTSFNATAVQLAESLEALGSDFVVAGVSFFAWCVHNLAPLDEEGVEGPFLGLALLSLAVKVPTIPDNAIIDLCKWIDNSVQTLLASKKWWATRKMNWLLSTNHEDLLNSQWIEVGLELQKWAGNQPTDDQATWVALIGASLAEKHVEPE